jgi:site-specific recombinase XerD
MTRSSAPQRFPALLQDFFSQYLMNQRNVSPQTVAAYRDTFRLLLGFVQTCRKKAPTDVQLADLDAPCILRFLDHLEHDRQNTIRSRNARLAAIRCFFHYAAAREPTCLPIAQRVLAIPQKRFDRPLLGFLSRQETQAILEAPDPATFSGQRDRILLALLYNTGARVSELAGLKVADLTLAASSSLQLRGKGRKQRCVPLWPTTARQLRGWLKRIERSPEAPLLPNAAGTFLTRSGIAKRLARAAHSAARKMPALQRRRISPHTFRHTTAMHLLQAGVDINVIALWLGHASPTTTHGYVEADLRMKEQALGRLQQPRTRPICYRPTDALLRFLEGL